MRLTFWDGTGRDVLPECIVLRSIFANVDPETSLARRAKCTEGFILYLLK